MEAFPKTIRVSAEKLAEATRLVLNEMKHHGSANPDSIAIVERLCEHVSGLVKETKARRSEAENNRKKRLRAPFGDPSLAKLGSRAKNLGSHPHATISPDLREDLKRGGEGDPGNRAPATQSLGQPPPSPPSFFSSLFVCLRDGYAERYRNKFNCVWQPNDFFEKDAEKICHWVVEDARFKGVAPEEHLGTLLDAAFRTPWLVERQVPLKSLANQAGSILAKAPRPESEPQELTEEELDARLDASIDRFLAERAKSKGAANG